MKVGVIGLEVELQEQCWELLQELGAGDWELIPNRGPSEVPSADYYLWDFQPDSAKQRPRAETIERCLFLVEPKHLDKFREFLGTTRASIVLKPVLPAALRPFLEHAARLAGITPGDVNSRTWDGEGDALLDCLLHANLKLQEYDQSRTNFLARAVHDFRAPLTALSGYCGLLIEQRLGPLSASQVELLRRMQHSVKRLSLLADAMFELSIGSHVRRELDMRKVDLESSISQAIHEVAFHAEEKQIRITVSVVPPNQPLVFDPAKIEQVLINLLENACKFTPKRGAIELAGYPVVWRNQSRPGRQAAVSPAAGAAANAYRIDVRDSGCGIPAQHIESIFEEYTSYGGGKDRSGGGLGLAICRMIVNAHHGSIWAESGEAGTQFSVVLPYATPASEDIAWMKAEPAAATAAAHN